ncbi:ArsR/SmtB family transcription factor [Bacillus fonticola]|uniref:ArsR/SmtB family transcription factor n=1 Tax=Bacillus fonticola TaxID=2728853 RepID=UPI00147475B7|nr:metalloregulator ArsR/SmtB family transcription factor [Bacillus fonticola]
MTVQEQVEIVDAAKVLKLLGDKTRLTMMKILADHDCCVCEFVEIFGMSQPSISQHMRKLKDAGLVEEERRGHWIFYSIREDHPHVQLVESVLASLPSQDDKVKELIKGGKRICC